MCDDCQAYAHHLGRADYILDAWGGTDAVQLTPSQISISSGHQHVRCLQLTSSGILRWYAGCCDTPMAHTVASPKVPFVGVPHTFMHHTSDGPAREEVVGPIQARVRGRYASRPLPADAHRGVPLRAALRAYALMFWAWVTRRHTPSPFFDVHSGAPIIARQILSASQREALRERVAQSPVPTIGRPS